MSQLLLFTAIRRCNNGGIYIIYTKKNDSTFKKDYDLKQSMKSIGVLYPILVDANGEIIDGAHRREADPKWPVWVLEDINDPVKSVIARLVANTNRRTLDKKEISAGLRVIASMTNWSPHDIADAIGMSYRWVMLHLPDEFKRSGGYDQRIAKLAIRSPDNGYPATPDERYEGVGAQLKKESARLLGVRYHKPRRKGDEVSCPFCTERIPKPLFENSLNRLMENLALHRSFVGYINSEYAKYLSEPLPLMKGNDDE